MRCNFNGEAQIDCEGNMMVESLSKTIYFKILILYSSSSNIPSNQAINLILENVAEGICPEFELNSDGNARKLFPEIMGDYLLQSVRNNGRNVYRTKEMFSRNNQTGFIYLYSINADEYADNEDYEEIKEVAGIWAVSFIKY